MRLRGDDRAQSMQVGAIILFGFLIIAMATYQAQVVPASNSATEFEHAQEVQGQFIDLRSAVLSAASTGNTESTSIALGTRYPQRTFFVNPPPATGSISTSDPQGIRIDNASVDADGNVGVYWDDRNLTFETRSVRYTPRYNEYDDPPDLVYEHSLVAAEFDDAVLSRTGQTAVENGEISLTLIDGNLSQSGVGQRGIDPEEISQNARSVTLSADTGENITLVLPTTIEGEGQRDDLASEWESEIEADANVTATAEGIRIEVDQQELDLRLAMVGLGRDTPQINESGGYITVVGEDTVEAGEEFTVEVRDQFNNPVEGAEVTPDHDALDPRETDTYGQATFTLDSEDIDGDSEVVTLSISGNATWKSTEFTISRDTGNGSGTGEPSNSAGQSGDSTWSENDTTETISSSGGVWGGIDNVNAIILDNPRLTPIAMDGEVDSESRYFRLAFVVGDPPEGETRYTFIFPPDAVEFEYENGQFQYNDNVPILVFEEGPDGASEMFEGEITNEAFTGWYQNGEELNLLNVNAYTDSNEVRDDVETIREHLFQNEDQEAYITDVMGRVDLTLEQREYDGGQAESVSYNSDGNTVGGNDEGVEFTISNTEDDQVAVQSVAVGTTSEDAAVLRDGTGSGQRVITVSGSNEGYHETGNEGYTIGEIVALTQPVSIPASESASVSLTRFYDGSSGGSGNYIDMSGEDVTVTLYFSDGTTKTITVSLPS